MRAKVRIKIPVQVCADYKARGAFLGDSDRPHIAWNQPGWAMRGSRVLLSVGEALSLLSDAQQQVSSGRLAYGDAQQISGDQSLLHAYARLAEQIFRALPPIARPSTRPQRAKPLAGLQGDPTVAPSLPN